MFETEIKAGNSILDYVPAEYIRELNPILEQVLAGKTVVREKEVLLNNQSHWFEFHFVPVCDCEGLVVGICCSAIEITEHKQTVDALVQSEARLLVEMESVLIITGALVRKIKLRPLLEFIMTQAEYLTEADGSAVMRLSDNGQYLEMASPGTDWLRIEPGSQLPVEESLPGLAVTTRQVRIFNHLPDDSRTAALRAALSPANIQALMCTPLEAQGKILGVLLVWFESDRIFTERDSRLIGLFADQSALALQNARLHAVSRELAIAQERHRIARDLHDSVPQALHCIGLAAQTGLRLLGDAPDHELRHTIEFIRRLSQAALTELRERLHRLYPTALAEKGLVNALTEHCDMLNKQYDVQISVALCPEPSLSSIRSEALYYITREALSNVVNHANAATAEVMLRREYNQIILTIVDDGCGFDPSNLEEGETMGLRSMRERIEPLGGIVRVQSKPGQGTRVTAELSIREGL